MKTELQVIKLSDLAEIQSYALATAAVKIPDEVERQFYSWRAPWREESLNHYLQSGWSFVARQGRTCVGFYLAQPILFFQGQTQVLWVEHVEAQDDVVTRVLVETAIGIAREKHLQKCIFSRDSLAKVEEYLPPSKKMGDNFWVVPTTKSME